MTDQTSPCLGVHFFFPLTGLSLSLARARPCCSGGYNGRDGTATHKGMSRSAMNSFFFSLAQADNSSLKVAKDHRINCEGMDIFLHLFSKITPAE